jgi:hypothetical protein
MGASVWVYVTPYQPDPEAALQRLRDEVFARGEYYKPWDPNSLLRLPLTQAPPWELASMSPGERVSMEEFYQSLPPPGPASPSPLPATIQELLELNAGSGTHTIPDIIRTSDHPDLAAASPLGEGVLIASYGTSQPTREQVASRPLVLGGRLERWHAVYFAVYKHGHPDEIVFMGCTGD